MELPALPARSRRWALHWRGPLLLDPQGRGDGLSPQVILAGRRINDGMGAYVASQLVKAMLKRRVQVDGARVLILGLTFKENCPDLRNTRVVDVVAELRDYGVQVDVHDPCVDLAEAQNEYGLALVTTLDVGSYDGVVLAVAHDNYRDAGATALRNYGRDDHVFFDLKSVFGPKESDLRL